MKTLLQINTCGNSGSTGRIADQIGELVIAKGWNSYIAFGRKKRKSKSNLIMVGGLISILLHAFMSFLFDRQGFGSRRATKKLIKQIDKIQPDVIHLHNLHGYYINIKILFDYLKQTNTPIVWTLHDCWPITGHCAYFDFVACRKWKTQCSNCPQKRVYPKSFLLDQSFKNHKEKRVLFLSSLNLTIVSVSQWLNNTVSESFLNTCSHLTITNSVDINEFSPKHDQGLKQKLGLENKFVMIGVASVWTRRKRLEDFIELGLHLKEDEVIILVGLSRKQMKNLPANIVGIEKTDRVSELAYLYSLADVVLNLSVEESFGLTTVEGFACGTPGIVYDRTASPELITYETGIIVKYGDIHLLVDAIRIIKKEGKLAYTKACRERAVQKYNRNDKYEEYFSLYQNILSNKLKH